MTTILQLLKSRTVIFAILLAVLSVMQGYIGLLPRTPIQQMYVGNGSVIFIKRSDDGCNVKTRA